MTFLIITIVFISLFLNFINFILIYALGCFCLKQKQTNLEFSESIKNHYEKILKNEQEAQAFRLLLPQLIQREITKTIGTIQ